MTKRLHFKTVVLFSRNEEVARVMRFREGLNLLHGTNNVGKSTLLKSVFACLGASVPNLSNPRWNGADTLTLLILIIDGVEYRILRDDKVFAVFSGADDFKLYRGITGANGISKFLQQTLNQNVALPTASDGEASPTPSFLLSPFYIDQDYGWNRAWGSFDLRMFKGSKKLLLNYYLGLEGRKLLKLRERERSIVENLSEKASSLRSIVRVRKRYTDKHEKRAISADLGELSERLEILTSKYEEELRGRGSLIDALEVNTNQRISLQSEIEILKRALRELDNDFQFLVSPSTPDIVDCPTCGAEYENSFAERFGLAENVSVTEELLKLRVHQLEKVRSNEEVSALELKELDLELSEIRGEFVSVKRGLTFQSVVLSESYRESLTSFDLEIAELGRKTDEFKSELAALRRSMKEAKPDKSAIQASYASLLKSALRRLDVQLTDESVVNDLYKSATSEALGSDVPRFVLARSWALRKLMQKYNYEVDCPIVVDTPMQQEQDYAHQTLIWNFIKENAEDESQYIVATTSESVRTDAALTETCHIIDLDNKHGLLTPDDFAEAKAIIMPLYSMLLGGSSEPRAI